MTAALRVAAAQGVSVPGDLPANVGTAVDLVGSAATRDARVVVLPELFLTGYDPDSWSPDTATTPDDTRLAPLADAAREHEVVVVVGAALRKGREEMSLSLLVVDEGGDVRGAYDKQHLNGPERGVFVPGDHGASLVVDDWELGLGVCYDGCFPEHARAAADDGAAAYLCAAAYRSGSEHRRDLYYAARALDNGIYVVMAGLTGECGETTYSGGSAAYDPEGRTLHRLGDEAPGVLVVDLDLAEVARVQHDHPLGEDRRTTLGGRDRHVLRRPEDPA